MNLTPDGDPVPADPWLREALRHAPGGDVPVPAAVRTAILDEARRAAAPARHRSRSSWRDAWKKLLTPTGMGWAGAVTAGVLVVLVTVVPWQSASPDLTVSQGPASGPAQVMAQKPPSAFDEVSAKAARPDGGAEGSGRRTAESADTAVALVVPPPSDMPTAKRAALPDAHVLKAPVAAAPAPAAAAIADPTPASESTRAGVAMAAAAPAAATGEEASPAGVRAAVAVPRSPSAPQASMAAAPAPTAEAAAPPVLAQATAVPPAAPAAAVSADTLRRAESMALAHARAPQEAASGAASQPRLASALAETTTGRSAAPGLMPARTVTEDRLGEVLQWTQGREGLRWAAGDREGPWGPEQDAWLRALRAAASGRWGEAPALPTPTATVVLQAPGQPAVRLSVSDAPWAVWVQVEGAAPFATRLDSRARARIESLRQGW